MSRKTELTKEENELFREKIQALYDWNGENPNHRGFAAVAVMYNGEPSFHIAMFRSNLPFSKADFVVERKVGMEAALAYQGSLLELTVIDAICEMEKTETVH